MHIGISYIVSTFHLHSKHEFQGQLSRTLNMYIEHLCKYRFSVMLSSFYRHFTTSFLRTFLPQCYITASSFPPSLFVYSVEDKTCYFSFSDIDLARNPYKRTCKGIYGIFPTFILSYPLPSF